MTLGTKTAPSTDSDHLSTLTHDPSRTAGSEGAFPWIAAVLLGSAGFLLNLLPVQLSPGTDLVFGGIPSLLAAAVFGPTAGLLAGALASARTIWIWGHPYGWLIFSLEAFVVGYLVRRRGTRPMVADLLFWVLAGIPVLYLVSNFGLRLQPVTFGVFALKQTLNGVFNAVLVEMLLLLPFVRWAMRIPGAPRLQSAIAVVVTTAAILPALIFGIWVGRREWTRNLEKAEERVVVYSQAYASKLEQFVMLHESAIRATASHSQRMGTFDPEQLQRIVAVAHEQFPAFVTVQAVNSHGATVAVHSRGGAGTDPLMAADHRTQPYFERLRGLGGTFTSDVLYPADTGSAALIVVAHPIEQADTFAGYMYGALDLSRLPEPIPIPLPYERLQVTDGQGATIFDSQGEPNRVTALGPITEAPSFRAVSSTGAPGITVFSAAPADSAGASTTEQRMLAGVARIPGLGWWVWMEEPFERIQSFIAESYLRLFGLLISVSLLALVVSTALARYVSQPLLRLRAAAGALASGDLVARVGRLPAALPMEIRKLGTGFDEMAAALTGRHEELEELGDIARTLAATLELRTLLPRITEAAERLVDPDGCGIALVSDAGTRLRAADYTLGILADRAGQEVPLDGSIPGWVTRTGRSALIVETKGDPRIGTDYLDAELIRSVICAPLIGRSGVLGALTAVRSRSSSRVFDHEDLQLLERLAGNAAVAVENARLLEAAEAASRAKSAFIATMSHELRTPLNGILGNLELLEIGLYGPLSTKQHDTIGRMQGATQQLRELIEDVLSFSKLESGRIEVELAETDLWAIVEEVASMIGPLAREKGLDFVAELDGEERPTLVTDPEKVRQILIYLGGNAVKFTREGEVSIRLRHGRGEVVVTVADTGVGIAPADRPRLFQPFEQIDSGLSRSYGGAGLGLYLSGRYAELVGGRIEVQSEPGKGSRFTLVLPMQQLRPRTVGLLATPASGG